MLLLLLGAAAPRALGRAAGDMFVIIVIISIIVCMFSIFSIFHRYYIS